MTEIRGFKNSATGLVDHLARGFEATASELPVIRAEKLVGLIKPGERRTLRTADS